MAQVIQPEEWVQGLDDNRLLPGRYTTGLFVGNIMGSNKSIANNPNACRVWDIQIPDYITEMLKEKNIPYTEVIKLEEVISDLDILYMTRVQKERFFNEAWQSGKCPESLNAGISQKIALGAFNQMIAHMNVQPQFIDSSTDDGKALFDKTMSESKRLIRMFAETVGNADPSLFYYTIENAIRAKENASDGAIIAAARSL